MLHQWNTNTGTVVAIILLRLVVGMLEEQKLIMTIVQEQLVLR